ncbi:hypothetical protein TTHERM_000471259 (macronuclear) [Tetrahymena thermophila SB210]|uniref:Uncharacterized protein n=1 Tax=Tetrahymena thermophila (strain SB210) TaxID=312017 RepID=W7X7I0_TETTS|nr:hypothetical protein TTHERM_000471259 [Tetrahymena thermophila SB210]EWS73312.1 hypothetical protein TTHERM_000471259 [Tetrahymena thermophila SB210]|eukprot:XP_012654161.1 hypothetical protein TTHERM_000471259 [Tetrahymena thermophila SB210]
MNQQHKSIIYLYILFEYFFNFVKKQTNKNYFNIYVLQYETQNKNLIQNFNKQNNYTKYHKNPLVGIYMLQLELLWQEQISYIRLSTLNLQPSLQSQNNFSKAICQRGTTNSCYYRKVCRSFKGTHLQSANSSLQIFKLFVRGFKIYKKQISGLLQIPLVESLISNKSFGSQTRPVSSLTSRIEASCIASPKSTLPPGKLHNLFLIPFFSLTRRTSSFSLITTPPLPALCVAQGTQNSSYDQSSHLNYSKSSGTVLDSRQIELSRQMMNSKVLVQLKQLFMLYQQARHKPDAKKNFQYFF